MTTIGVDLSRFRTVSQIAEKTGAQRRTVRAWAARLGIVLIRPHPRLTLVAPADARRLVRELRKRRGAGQKPAA